MLLTVIPNHENIIQKTEPQKWLHIRRLQKVLLKFSHEHMGQYQLLSVLAARLSPLNIDHSGNLPVEICGINYTEKYTNL